MSAKYSHICTITKHTDTKTLLFFSNNVMSSAKVHQNIQQFLQLKYEQTVGISWLSLLNIWIKKYGLKLVKTRMKRCERFSDKVWFDNGLIVIDLSRRPKGEAFFFFKCNDSMIIISA